MSATDLRVPHFQEIRHTLTGKRLEVYNALARVASATPTELAGIMGWPVSHSRSPRLHGFWLEKHRIDEQQRLAIFGE